MKATLNSIGYTSKNMDSFRKESSFYKEISAIDPKDGRAVISARFYGSGSVAYCVLWMHGGGDNYGTGCGKAGGYGYHKESAALAEAIRDLGAKLDSSISGRGNTASVEAVAALARAATGRRKFFTHEAHA